MALSDIAAGIELTAEQDRREVAAVDDTDGDLVARLRPHADALPCTPEAAATVVETHTAGAAVGDSAEAAGVAPVTAAKALHRCGVAGISPLSPTARQVVRDWLAGELSRADALALTDADEAQFALATYVESHDPVEALVAAVAACEDRPGADPLADARSEVDDFL